MANQDLTPTKDDIKILSQDNTFIEMMKDAFNLMLMFYGLKYTNDNLIEISTEKDRGREGKDRFMTYFVLGGSGKHNHLRITRILQSLKLFELITRYNSFRDFSVSISNRYGQQYISDETKKFWLKT